MAWCKQHRRQPCTCCTLCCCSSRCTASNFMRVCNAAAPNNLIGTTEWELKWEPLQPGKTRDSLATLMHLRCLFARCGSGSSCSLIARLSDRKLQLQLLQSCCKLAEAARLNKQGNALKRGNACAAIVAIVKAD